MRASVASLSRKIISVFFAATLALGLVPAAAFAEPVGDAAVPQNSESAAADSDMQAEAEAGDASTDVISSEGDEVPGVEKSRPSNEGEDTAQAGEDANLAVPAGDMINQEMELDTVVAQVESTRSFFLAQTLENTRTVPVVSAKLPIDTDANDAADAVADEDVGTGQPEGEGDSSEEGDGSDSVTPAISAESTVVGAFEYLGMTFAIEPGGESVALMAVDYSKLPEEFIQKQVLVIPDTATPDGVDYYSVTRIADDAFAGLTKDNANPDYVGCEALFADEELLAEAGIDPSEVQEFLSDGGAAVAAQNGQDADASSDIQAEAEASAYGDQATSEPAIVSRVVDLNGGDASNPHVISSGVSGANGVEKSRPSDEGKDENDIRTIVSMEGNTATLDDGSTYTFTNPLAGCAGILALGIPASVTTMEDDALSGFTTLQYVVVSEDNTTYASYDGALYSADLTNLRSIPEGRVGAVRVAPSATGADPEVFSHCPSVDALVADAEGGAYQLLLKGGYESTVIQDILLKPTTVSAEEDMTVEVVLRNCLNKRVGLLTSDIIEDGTGIESLLSDISSRLTENSSSVAVYQSLDDAKFAKYDFRRDDSPDSVFFHDGAMRKCMVAIYDPAQNYSMRYTSKSQTPCAVGTISTENNVNTAATRVGDWYIFDHDSWSSDEQGRQSAYEKTYGYYYRAWSNTARWCMQVCMPSGETTNGFEIVDTPLIAHTTSGYAIGSHTTADVTLVFPPPYTSMVEYEGTFRDESNENEEVKGVWGWRGNAGEPVSFEEYDTGIVYGEEAKFADPSADEYYVPIPESIDKLQYTFIGWNDKEDGSGSWYYRVKGTPDRMTTAGNLKLYAIYKRGYDLIWQSNSGDSPIASDIIPYDEAGTSLSRAIASDGTAKYASFDDMMQQNAVQRNGWEFDDWYKDSSCAAGENLDESDFARVMADADFEPDGELSFYAKWESTATWDANGGMLSGPAMSEAFSTSYDTSEGADNRAEFAVPDDPIAPDGWEFAGWAATPDPADPLVDDTLPVIDGKIYNHLADDEAKAGRPTFYARYAAKVDFGSVRDASGVALPEARWVYASGAPGKTDQQLTATLTDDAATMRASLPYYRFLGFKTVSGPDTNDAVAWYRYGEQTDEGFRLDLTGDRADTIAPATPIDEPAASDAVAAFADGMAFTVKGDTTFWLLWAPVAYKMRLDAYAETDTAGNPIPKPITILLADEKWSKLVGDAGATWERTYTYDDEVAMSVPVPQLYGYSPEFSGFVWSDGGARDDAAAIADDGKSATLDARKAIATNMGADVILTFKTQWVKSPYLIKLLNVAGGQNGAITFAYDATGALKPLGDVGFSANSMVVPELKSGHPQAGDNPSYFFDSDYQRAFTGWNIFKVNTKDGASEHVYYVPASSMEHKTFARGAAKRSAKPAERFASLTVNAADLEDFFAEFGTTDASGNTVVYAEANYEATPWNARIGLDGGQFSGASVGDGGWTVNAAADEAARTYDYEDELVLPMKSEVSKRGYELTGWKMTSTPTNGDERTKTLELAEDGTASVPVNTVYDLAIAPVWTASASVVAFDINAPAGVDSPEDPNADMTVEATFDAAMGATGKLSDGTAKGLTAPACEGYTLAGYFDAAGIQYYSATLASTRAWDKEPTGTVPDHVLYAKWFEGEDGVNGETVRTVPSGGSDSFADVSSATGVDGTGAGRTAFKTAAFTGLVKWDSTGAVPSSDDTVTVEMSSYAMSPSAAEVKSDFAAAGKTLVGFRVKSTGSMIPFQSLLAGASFRFSCKGSDLADRAEAPSFTIAADKVVPVYIDSGLLDDAEQPDPNDPTKPYRGAIVTTNLDANGGRFGTGSAATSQLSLVTVCTGSADQTVDATAGNGYARPDRAGYDFLGWSPVRQHSDGDAHSTADDLSIDSTVPATWYAHWAAQTNPVQFRAENGNAADSKLVADVAYDANGMALGEGDLPEKPSWTGRLFLGYFDAEGKQYFASTGAQVRVWDKERCSDGAPHELFAHWVNEAGRPGDEGSTPTRPLPDDPFPGVDLTVGTTKTVVTQAPNDRVSLAAAGEKGPWDDAAIVMEGAYDGVVSYHSADTGITALGDDDDVVVTLFSYDFDGASVRAAFEAADMVPDSALPYLQGFRVKSTGCVIPLLTLWNGGAFTMNVKGADLESKALADLASFTMGADRIEPIYGSTPAVPPDNEGIVAPDVTIVFDASVGRFPNGLRFADTIGSYDGRVVFPVTEEGEEMEPVYLPGGRNEGWSFAGWVDAAGNPVTDGTVLSDSKGPYTFYATYSQSRHDVTFVAEGVDGYAVQGIDELPDGTQALYDGQSAAEAADVFAAASSVTFYLPGFDFLGWFEKRDIDGEAVEVPCSLNAELATAEQRALYNRYKDEPIRADVTVYSRWTPITYEFTYRYDIPEAQMPSDPAYRYEHPEGAVTVTLRYGDAIAVKDDPVFGEVLSEKVPLPQNAWFVFKGWYASAAYDEGKELYVTGAFDTDAASAGYRTYADGSYAARYFERTVDGYSFRPAVDVPRQATFYAKWQASKQGEIKYAVKLFPGENGYIANAGKEYDADAVSWTHPSVDLTEHSAHLSPNQGYEFDHWTEKVDTAEGVAWEPVERIDRENTAADREVMALWRPVTGEYSVRLSLGSNLGGATLSRADAERWGASMSLPIDVSMDEPVALPTPVTMKDGDEVLNGYEFKGWRMADASFAGLDGDVAEVGRAFTPAELIEDPGHWDTRTFCFVAEWAPKTYKLTFQYFPELSPLHDESESVEMEVGYEQKLVLPVPATTHNDYIFSNWDVSDAVNAQNTACADWTSGKRFASAKSFIDAAFERMDDVTALQRLRDHDELTVYGTWKDLVVTSGTLPLTVNFLIDPYTGETWVNDSKAYTHSTDEVEVKSLVYMREDPAAGSDMPDLDALFTNGERTPSDMKLQVRAGRLVTEEGAVGTPLELLLDAAGAETGFSELADAGFAPFTRNADLPVRYGLKLPAGCDLSQFMGLRDARLLDAYESDGSRKSVPIMRLYYTIGLAG